MKPVTIYSTPVCHFCNMAKAFFQEKGIAYTEFNVAADAEKRREMIDLTGQLGVPVIRVGDNIVVGFREEVVADMLGIRA